MMQGFAMMLKSMGLDANAIKAQIEAVAGHLKQSFARLEDGHTEIRSRLASLESRLATLEAKIVSRVEDVSGIIDSEVKEDL